MNMKRNMFLFISKWYANRILTFNLAFYVEIRWINTCQHKPERWSKFWWYKLSFDFRFLNFRISVSNLDRCSINAEAQSAHQVWMHQSYCSLLGVFFQRACMEADSKWVFVCRKVLLQHFIGFLNVSGRSHHFFNPARTRRYSQYMD